MSTFLHDIEVYVAILLFSGNKYKIACFQMVKMKLKFMVWVTYDEKWLLLASGNTKRVMELTPKIH